MKEQEWLASPDVAIMWHHLTPIGDSMETRISDWKARMFGCACVQLNSNMQDEEYKLGRVEKYEAEGFSMNDVTPTPDLAWARGWVSNSHNLTKASKAQILREIRGNPFLPELTQDSGGGHLFSPSWRTPDVLKVAAAIHKDRDWEALPFLVDALLEAGCPEEIEWRHRPSMQYERIAYPLIAHFRGREFVNDANGAWRICEKCDHPFPLSHANHPTGRCPNCQSDRYCKARWFIPIRPIVPGVCHVRGCWALDLVLGRS